MNSEKHIRAKPQAGCLSPAINFHQVYYPLVPCKKNTSISRCIARASGPLLARHFPVSAIKFAGAAQRGRQLLKPVLLSFLLRF